jgi:glycine cleavage system aminomethyltransferase T
VARIDSRGHTNRALTGLVVRDEVLPAPGEKLFARDGDGGAREAGWITSVAPFSPAAGGRPIALAYVRHEHRSPGACVTIGDAASGRLAEIVGLPFTRNRPA